MNPGIRRITRIAALLALAAMAVSSCQQSESPRTSDDPKTGEGRSESPIVPVSAQDEPAEVWFGLTDFPHAPTTDALLEAYVTISREASMAVLHLDGGVPWPEALAETRYPERFATEIGAKAALFPKDMTRFVAITPINFERNGLAAYRGNTPNENLPLEWSNRTFDSPEVVEAYINYARSIVDAFSPDYFAYAIEANLLVSFSPGEWSSFVDGAAQIYETLKTEYPDLPLIITLNLEAVHKNTTEQAAAIAEILPYTDVLAVSAYPFFTWPKVENIPSNYFSTITSLAPGKPFAIAETGWPAEPIPDSGEISIPGTPTEQDAYLKLVVEYAENESAVFVTWFFSRDFDATWDADLSEYSAAPKLRMFRDLGLIDGDGNPRPALQTWRAAVSPSTAK